MDDVERVFLLNPASSHSLEAIQRIGALSPAPHSQVNLENVKDFSHVCRTCATITEFLMPIYAGEGLQNNLAEKINKHLPIQVNKRDELPLVVCYQCASTLLAFHELVKCCEQADAALHIKLRSNQRKLNGQLDMKDEDAEAKQSLQEYRACVYCATAHPAQFFKQHLVLVHGDLLFLCEVCDMFVDRKDFIMHMSYHTMLIGNEERIKKMTRKKKEATCAEPRPAPLTPVPHTPALTTPAPPTPAPPTPVLPTPALPTPALPMPAPPTPAPVPATQVTPKTESKPLVIIEVKKPAVTAKTKTNVQVNEFSDHSDIDDFGPLPESVFEAIEDTQDSQDLEDNTNQTPENERLTDESNKSSPPENKNSSNPGQCLENNNFTNNCSVVIEPIDTNSGAQSMNASSNTSKNLVPATKTAPKTHSHPTKMSKRNRNKLRKCPLCPKEYQVSSSYFYHLKYSHKSSKEYECEVCGRKFATRSYLTQHMAVHAAQYEFECKQCQKQFKSKAGLYIHEQTHGANKSWSCSQCPAAFRWRTHLLRHLRRHAGERGHVCATCGRGFSVRCDLLRHARTHSAGSFACLQCGQKFAQLRYLKVHTTKQHNINVKKK